MPLKIVRPQLAEDQREELENYLLERWQRAVDSRTTQIDDKYLRWKKAYDAVPREKIRSFPWYKSSNIVIPVSRIYIDTFVARSLNIIFSTRPLITVEGFSTDQQEALRFFLNALALSSWRYYELARQIMLRGPKAGSAFIKSYWKVKQRMQVLRNSQDSVEEIPTDLYIGPCNKPIPFEDFYAFPITAEDLDDTEIIMQKVRTSEYQAVRNVREGRWSNLTEEEITNYSTTPADARRSEDADKTGVVDPHTKEFEHVECHLDWSLGGQYYHLVCVIVPRMSKLIDTYHYPYPANIFSFSLYRPYPREEFLYGDSLCQMLEMQQEEISQIHNDRRNNSMLANTVTFKKRQGALIPNPSSDWFPGKVWELESLEDLDVLSVGRNFNDMIQEEEYSFQLIDRLVGMGPLMQGMSTGSMDKKRGVYNTQGTLGVLAESNQRQDTNIRDVRAYLGALAENDFRLCSYFRNDINTDFVPTQLAGPLAEALSTKPGPTMRLFVAASNAGANAEVHKASLYQLAQVMGQYGTSIQQLAMQLVNPQLNQGLRVLFTDIVTMYRWIAKRLLYVYNEYEGEEFLPDVRNAVEAVLPGGFRSSASSTQRPTESGLVSGGAESPPDAAVLERLLSLPGAFAPPGEGATSSGMEGEEL